jgi:hypothetical protein
MFPTVATSLGQVHICSRGELQRTALSVSSKYMGMLAIKSLQKLHSHTIYVH